MKFEELVGVITETDQYLKQKAYNAINQTLTIKNWLTGFYIVEFEQNGEDRAKYGEKLLQKLSNELQNKMLNGYSYRNLKLYRQFYFAYFQIGQSVIAQMQLFDNLRNTIGQSLIAQFNEGIGKHNLGNKSYDTIWITLTSKLEKSISNNIQKQSQEYFGVEIETLIKKLSYTHLVELIKIDEPVKRAFYEIECINGNWSVRELQRQIGSLLFERTGLSTNKEKMIAIANKKSSHFLPDDIIRDPYVFEFLGLKQSEVLPETSFEELLIVHLQEFLLELGKGFCFEARQRRITIDNKHYYIDLVFYHKILKCNIIIELKTRDFEHADASQLRVYLNYYRKNEMLEGDNPPIGILLCTNKSQELVEYATAGIDEQMFISKYMLELPTKEQLQKFLHNQKELIVVS